MSDVYRGQCRCGEVSYGCASEPVDVKICHCRDCQYASGSAFSTIAYFPEPSCIMKGATHHYSVKGDAGMTVNRHFCPTCGTPMFSTLTELPGIIFIKVGTLDNPSAVKPSGHMWCDSMVEWLSMDDDLERLPGNPPL